MIKLKFNKSNPPKDGRYICLIESEGKGFSMVTESPVKMIENYICCGNWLFNKYWMLDNPYVFRIHGGKDKVIGWCEFEYDGGN